MLAKIALELCTSTRSDGAPGLDEYLSEKFLRIGNLLHVPSARQREWVGPAGAAGNPANLDLVKQKPCLSHSNGYYGNDYVGSHPSLGRTIGDLRDSRIWFAALSITVDKPQVWRDRLTDDAADALAHAPARRQVGSGIDAGHTYLSPGVRAEAFKVACEREV